MKLVVRCTINMAKIVFNHDYLDICRRPGDTHLRETTLQRRRDDVSPTEAAGTKETVKTNVNGAP